MAVGLGAVVGAAAGVSVAPEGPFVAVGAETLLPEQPITKAIVANAIAAHILTRNCRGDVCLFRRLFRRLTSLIVNIVTAIACHVRQRHPRRLRFLHKEKTPREDTIRKSAEEMEMPTTAPYGSWRSPITPDLIVAGATSLGQVAWDGPDLYWVEMRPDEGGRMVVVRRSASGEIDDITPKPFSVRTRVHEYGGGAFLVDSGVVYFSNFADQRLYRQDPGNTPRPITPEVPLRYADGVIDRLRGRIICVREDHSGPGEPVNAIVAVDITGACPQEVLYSSSDFCSTPRLSPDGASLAWLTWDHPNMPWDGTELLVAAVDEQGRLGAQRLVAGGKNESIFQPGWSSAGELHFVSDRTGWWNLYRRRGGEIQSLAERTAEFGKPQWTFDSATYGFLDEDRIACCYNTLGSWSLAVLNTRDGSMTALDSGDSGDAPYSEMGRGDLKADAGRVAFVAGGPAEAMSLVVWEASTVRVEAVRRSHLPDVDAGYLSAPSPVEFPTGGGKTAHAFYYPPANRDYSAPAGEKPPLLIKSHGGPTAAASTALDLGIQFWTSRGFAVADVNYGGSTGYGTEYRRRLNGAWGVVDVEDCVSAALYLAERGYADPERLAIDGGSAGGYTTPGRPHFPGCLPSRYEPLRGERPRGIGQGDPQIRVPLPGQPGGALPGTARLVPRTFAHQPHPPAVLPVVAAPRLGG